MSAPRHCLTPEQVAAIRARKIVWSGSSATCGHIYGGFNWCDGVIAWRAFGEPLGRVEMNQSTAGFDARAAKLEAMARRQVEARIRELAAEIEQAYLTDDQEPNR